MPSSPIVGIVSLPPHKIVLYSNFGFIVENKTMTYPGVMYKETYMPTPRTQYTYSESYLRSGGIRSDRQSRGGALKRGDTVFLVLGEWKAAWTALAIWVSKLLSSNIVTYNVPVAKMVSSKTKI